MLTNQTMQKLIEMRLPAMANEYARQQEITDIGAMDFDSRFGLLVDTEWISRTNNRIKRLFKEANLRITTACLADVNYNASRNLDRSFILRLSNFVWVKEARNLLITGCTGTGKSWLSCALGADACRREIKVGYYRANRLLNELRISSGDGSLTKLLNKLKKTELLILDDWGLSMLSPADGQLMMEVLEDRYELSSTIIAAQAPVSKWHDLFEDSTLADAVLDRAISNAYRIELQGPSLRRKNVGVEAASGGKSPLSDDMANVVDIQPAVTSESGIENVRI